MSAGRKVHSQNSDWGTPFEYIEAVRTIFDGTISLDPCSNEYSLVNAQQEYRLPTDGLKESWNYPTIYVNPPYGRDYERKTTIKDWLQKCTDAHCNHKSEVIALIPVATNTKHWQENIFHYATSICFLKATRLRFLQFGRPALKGAPMACCLVYWGCHHNKFATTMDEFGITLDI